MGVYIYSLRAKTVPLVVDAAGTIVTAHLYSYAYRMTSYWPGERGYNSYKLTESNTERHAQNVFDAYAGSVPFVVIADADDLKKGLDGHSIYANVTKPVWYDTDKFPGQIVGWVRKVGTRNTLSDRTEWSKGTKALRGDAWVPIRTRSVMIDGVATYQSEDVEDEPATATF